MINWKYILSWIPGIPIAIVNGIIRDSFYRQFLNELHAHQLSALSFFVLFGIYVWFILKWLKLDSLQDGLRLGLTWLVLTVAFEFLFGHFVMGHPWERLFHDYNLLAGRVWVLVLLWIAAAPLIFFRMARGRSRPTG
jgi:apolipoprotein N-acyltransferase